MSVPPHGRASTRRDVVAAAAGALMSSKALYAEDVRAAAAFRSYAELRRYAGDETECTLLAPGLFGLFLRDAAEKSSADNGGTVIVDARGRRWRRLCEDGEYNVAWFGASGDGTPQQAFFNAAAAALAEQGGGVLVVPRRRDAYRFTGTFRIPTQVRVCGRGTPRLLFQAATPQQADILFHSTRGSGIDSCEIVTSRGAGIPTLYLSGDNEGTVISRNSFSGDHGDRRDKAHYIGIDGADNNNVTIERNTLRFGGYGIVLGLFNPGTVSGDGYRIVDNLIEGSTADCIELNATSGRCSGFVVERNILSTDLDSFPPSGGFGIGAARCRDLLIARNVIRASNHPAIHVEDASERISIVENIISESAINGIELLDAAGAGRKGVAARQIVVANNIINGRTATKGIADIQLTNPGSGYTSVPQVKVAATHGIAAAASAFLTVVRAGIVNRGAGYSRANVVLSGGGLHEAEGVAVVEGGAVDRVEIHTGGSSYRQQPNVLFSGGGGEGAEGTAIVNERGQVESVVMTSGGRGYSSPPSVTFVGGLPHAQVRAMLSGGGIAGVEVVSGGRLYTTPPQIVIHGDGNGASGTVVMGVGELVIDYPGIGFDNDAPAQVTVTGGGGSGCAARATSRTLRPFGLRRVRVTAPGSGYGAATTVGVTDPNGSGAEFVVNTVAGVIHRVSVVRKGWNYGTPALEIAGGRGTGAKVVSGPLARRPTNASSYGIKLTEFSADTIREAVISNNKIQGGFFGGVLLPVHSGGHVVTGNNIRACSVGIEASGFVAAGNNHIEEVDWCIRANESAVVPPSNSFSDYLLGVLLARSQSGKSSRSWLQGGAFEAAKEFELQSGAAAQWLPLFAVGKSGFFDVTVMVLARTPEDGAAVTFVQKASVGCEGGAFRVTHAATPDAVTAFRASVEMNGQTCCLRILPARKLVLTVQVRVDGGMFYDS